MSWLIKALHKSRNTRFAHMQAIVYVIVRIYIIDMSMYSMHVHN